MWHLAIVVTVIVAYVLVDVNYFVRSLFSVLCGRIYQEKATLKDVTTIYGWCTPQDCDITFSSMRAARAVRELDFGRYHFYDRTGVYARSRRLGVASLQGCTLLTTYEDVPLWSLYKINTKLPPVRKDLREEELARNFTLVFWDKCSLFLEHEVITLCDGKTRMFLVSRQHALGPNGAATEALLKDLPGADDKPACPVYLTHWLDSMAITSSKLRPRN